MTEIEQRAFRDAMSLFASGVTVVAADDGEEWHGITVASFASVSLSPPLALICVGEDSRLLPILRRAGGFSVHVLTDAQAPLAQLFAKGPHEERRETLIRRTGAPPELPGALAGFDMRLYADYPGGDHAVILGELTRIRLSDSLSDETPLSWWRGRLGALKPA